MSRSARSLRWLGSFANPQRGIGWNPRSHPDPAWNVRRTRALLDLAGEPDRRLECVLVAGTKGKGSTAAFLASILGAAGVRAGLYTSPHLQAYRERIRVDGRALGETAFADAIDAVRPAVAALASRLPEAGAPTAFEITTVAALVHFARSRCRAAVVEVGLGGRFDATNAVDPSVSVITAIGYDHTAILGRTLGAIAREKAGILRDKTPALLACQRPSARAALLRACREAGARCREVGPLPVTATLGIRGGHQLQNAALAAEAARALPGVFVDERAIHHGLRRVRWPGRFEVVAGRPPVVLDGAHNAESAEALAATLRPFLRGRPLHLVIGMRRDKDARATLRPLLSLATAVYATAATDLRALSPDELAAAARGRRPVQTASDVGRALERARAAAGAQGVVCVTGSLALIGEARTALGLPIAERLWEGTARARR